MSDRICEECAHAVYEQGGRRDNWIGCSLVKRKSNAKRPTKPFYFANADYIRADKEQCGPDGALWVKRDGPALDLFDHMYGERMTPTP